MAGMEDWIKDKMLSSGNISEGDMFYFNVLDDPQEIVNTIKRTVII
jgi:predicted Rossmann-fold nucleotide-binding protein